MFPWISYSAAILSIYCLKMVRNSQANSTSQSIRLGRCSITVSISACHAGDPGSIPGSGAFFGLLRNYSETPEPVSALTY